MIPKCAHKGPDEREAGEGLTTEENVGDMMGKTDRSDALGKWRKEPQGKGHRRLMEAANGKERMLPSEPPGASSPADALTSASETDYRLLISRTGGE